MLTITPQALRVIQRVTASVALQPAPGVRIASGDSPSDFEVRAVSAPHPGDNMVESHGARLYLDANAAERVNGTKLDAVNDPDGRVRFILRSAA